MDVESVTLALHDALCSDRHKCGVRNKHAARISGYMNMEPIVSLLMNANRA